jgi:hypothetical protein
LLVAGLKHFFYFPQELGMSSSQLAFIFFRGVDQPPTSLDQDIDHLAAAELGKAAKLSLAEVDNSEVQTLGARGNCT